MVFFGGVLIGCDFGILNFVKIKGSYIVMKFGMFVVDVIVEVLVVGCEGGDELFSYVDVFKVSWLYDELFCSCNFGVVIYKFGVIGGGVFNFIDQNIFGGKIFVILYDDKLDYVCLKKVSEVLKIDYLKLDGKFSFDKLFLVFFFNINYEEDQLIYFKLVDVSILIEKNLLFYDELVQCYCLVGVYEVVVNDDGSKCFQINVQNCVYCKICDIKDLVQNIIWVVLEGIGGLNYFNM